MANRAARPGGEHDRRVLAHERAHRRRSRHHQQSGPDQRAGAVSVGDGDREADHFPHRKRARRDTGARIDAIPLAQRLRAGHGDLQRQGRSLLRAPAGDGTPQRRESGLSARRRGANGADRHGPFRNLHVVAAIQGSRRRAAGGWRAGLPEQRRLSHARRRAFAQRPREGRLSAHAAGLGRPPAGPNGAGGRERRLARRLRQAVPGRARSGEAPRSRPLLRRRRERHRAQQCVARRRLHRALRRRPDRAQRRPSGDDRRYP